MVGYRLGVRDTRSARPRGAYVLIVRGPDGLPRAERFNDLAAYRARLLTLNTGETSENGSVSIEEIAGLLDSQ
jgi:hypothetical protein